MTIAGIILAAGLSERMEDGPKQLLPLGDHTMLGHVVATAEATQLEPIVVVTGHRAEEIEAVVTPERARFARNPDYERGNMSSLKTGFSAIGDPDAAMILLADQPEVDGVVVETIAAAWRRRRPFAAVARYTDEVGHPWVLSARAITDSSDLTGTKALFAWLTDEHADRVLEVEIRRPKPIDVNTPGDYRAALERMGVGERAES